MQASGSDDPRAIRESIKGQTCDAPYGAIRIDPVTLHTVQIARVGRVNDDGRLAEVYLSPQAILPEPYPASRSRQEWKAFSDGLYKTWGGRWSNAGQ